MRSPLVVDSSRLLEDLRTLAVIGKQPSGGVTRVAYSPEYWQAVQWLVERMGNAGLSARVDAVGNVIGRLGDQRASAIVCGSHIDTVPDGGWLDGAYGVLAGLECARVIAQSGLPAGQALEVVAFVDEEGAFVSLLGSRAMTGNVSVEEVLTATNVQGGGLQDEFRRAGLDPRDLRKAMRTPDEIDAYVELHIEQGPVLEQQRKFIGVVRGIVGILVANVEFSGSADHAGTTPIALRQDALRGAAEFITSTYDRFEERSSGARVTFGAIDVRPGASNVVPRFAGVVQEIRGPTTSDIESAFEDCAELANATAQRRGLAVQVTRLSFDEPAEMSGAIMRAVEESCDELRLSWMRMASGAGHDAQSFARRHPAGMIFVPSRCGASHRPDEHTEEADLVRGANVLLATLVRLLGCPADAMREGVAA